jgi:hypothetical protein
MLRSLNVPIPAEAALKLDELARREFRRPRDQAAVLLIDALRRLDLETKPAAREPETKANR